MSSLIVFGGAIPTHAPAEILRKYRRDAISCIGEGELALAGAVRYLKKHYISLNEIPNICFLQNGIEIYTKKILIDNLKSLGLPKRRNVEEISYAGGQVYIEASRGCSWGKCTFCAIREKNKTRRTIPVNDLIENIKNLATKCNDSQEVVFTDEEFMGDDSDSLDRTKIIAELLIKENLKFNFYVATRAKSIFSLNDTEDLRNIKIKTLRLLKKSGLGRVFLGIESGSRTQLRRYRKGTSPSENINAIKVLEKLGIQLDIGLIIFDPLMTLEEIIENIKFIENAEIIGKISVLAHEIRIQENTPILKMIRNEENKLKSKIIGDFDLNTLSYPIIKYKNPKVTADSSWHKTCNCIKWKK